MARGTTLRGVRYYSTWREVLLYLARGTTLLRSCTTLRGVRYYSTWREVLPYFARVLPYLARGTTRNVPIHHTSYPPRPWYRPVRRAFASPRAVHGIPDRGVRSVRRRLHLDRETLRFCFFVRSRWMGNKA